MLNKMKKLKKLLGLLIVAWGRTPVNLIWRKPTRPIDPLYLATSRIIHRDWKNDLHPYTIRLLYIYMLAIWPLRVMCLTLFNIATYGEKAKHVFGIGYAKQVLDQLSMGMYHNINPDIYYKYELFSAPRRERAKSYIGGNVASVLFAILNRFDKGPAIEDKQHVAEVLARKNLPTVPLIAKVSKNQMLAPDGTIVDLPLSDFIFKPNRGMQGQSIYRFELVESDTWLCSNSKVYAYPELVRFLYELTSERDYLVQPRLLGGGH